MNILRVTNLLFLLAILPLPGQETEEYGFLNIIHAIPEGGICHIKIDGDKINDDGFKPGEFSGGLLLKTGAHSLTIDFEGKDTATGSVDIAKGVTSSYAIFNHTVVSKKDGKPENRIRIIRLEPKTVKGYHLEAVSLCETIPRIQVSGKPFEVKFLKSVEIPGWNGGAFTVSANTEKLGTLAVEESGTYVVLVGRNSEGKNGAFFFRHFDFELPEWFREPKP